MMIIQPRHRVTTTSLRLHFSTPPNPRLRTSKAAIFMRPSLLALLVAAWAVLTSSFSDAVRIHRGVHRQLQQDGRADIVVVMRTTPHEAFVAGDTSSPVSRGAKISSLVQTLETRAAAAQEGINKLLAREAATATPLYEEQHSSWIMNARYFQGATWNLVEALSLLPEVAEIREQETYEIDDNAQTRSLHIAVNASTNEWGVGRIKAPQVWAEGINGSGIVVGSIDSGVRSTHQLLQRNFRRDYSWFSPGDRSSSPQDLVGHGTHTMGTMVGADGIGIAPGAQWIACVACRTTCTEAAIVQCTEWMLCPTDTNGNNKDCSKAPHVINNSWSTRSGSTTHKPVIDAWVAAGIVPVFSNGNKGPTCSTVQSPGDYDNVISVGNVAINGSLSRSSSRGPSLAGLIKPDVSAPGHQIVSASNLNDQDLALMSGTSMAAPHVAGAAALLLSAKPGLSAAEVRQLLTSTADTVNTVDIVSDCEGVGLNPVSWPNNIYGYGIVDVYAAYRKIVPTPTQQPSPPTPSPSPSITTQTPTTPAPVQPSACSLEYQVDIVGGDIGSVLSSTASGCCSLCFEYAKCRAFTWSSYNGGTCWFKDTATGPRKTTSDTISAAVDRDSSGPCRIAVDADFAGNDLTSVASGSPGSCCSLCAERRWQGCKAYTWSNYQGGTCWLKTSQGTTTRSPGLQSGVYGI